jgi:hypothetical protein
LSSGFNQFDLDRRRDAFCGKNYAVFAAEVRIVSIQGASAGQPCEQCVSLFSWIAADSAFPLLLPLSQVAK